MWYLVESKLFLFTLVLCTKKTISFLFVHLQLSGGESILDNSAQIDQLVTEKSELQSKAEQVRGPRIA